MPGDLDPTFGEGGVVTTDFADFDVIFAFAGGPGGKIVAVGGGGSGDDSDFAVARYNQNGALDATFGNGGTEVLDFGAGLYDFATSLVRQPDGKLVAAGVTETEPMQLDFALARFNPDGTLDQTFGSGGKVLTDFAGSSDEAHALALQPDGKLLVAGRSVSDGAAEAALVRYNPDGSLDGTFGIGGKVTTDFGSDDSAATALMLDGVRPVVAGYAFVAGRYDFALARYKDDGTLDQTFGTGGRVIGDFGPEQMAFGLAMQRDKIVAVGRRWLDWPTGQDMAVARYNSDGSPDSSFGSGGLATADLGSINDDARAVVVTRGKIIVAGSTQDDATNTPVIALVRFKNDGAIDETFGTDGTVTTAIGFGASSFALTIQRGKLLTGGAASTSSGGTDFVLARYLLS